MNGYTIDVVCRCIVGFVSGVTFTLAATAYRRVAQLRCEFRDSKPKDKPNA